MEALVLTSGTGGGHHSAAEAIAETLTMQGHSVHLLDPYTLLSPKTATFINQTYMTLVREAPSVFGGIYLMADQYRKIAKHSPVYTLNKHQTKPLADYLARNKIEIILATHLFPAELVTALKKQQAKTPPIIYIATDYASIPFTEETECDAYVVAHEALISEFSQYGIPEAKIYPFGIPTKRAFQQKIAQKAAKKILGLDIDCDYWLLAGGTIGINKMQTLIDDLVHLVKAQEKTKLIVITGNKAGVLAKVQARYRKVPEIIIVETTKQMAVYLAASNCFFSKPGGLSSTEALMMQIPLIHIKPIPGVETKNQAFFVEHGLSISATDFIELQAAITKLQHRDYYEKVCNRQREYAKPGANQAIMELAATLVTERKQLLTSEEGK